MSARIKPYLLYFIYKLYLREVQLVEYLIFYSKICNLLRTVI